MQTTAVIPPIQMRAQPSTESHPRAGSPCRTSHSTIARNSPTTPQSFDRAYPASPVADSPSTVAAPAGLVQSLAPHPHCKFPSPLRSPPATIRSHPQAISTHRSPRPAPPAALASAASISSCMQLTTVPVFPLKPTVAAESPPRAYAPICSRSPLAGATLTPARIRPPIRRGCPTSRGLAANEFLCRMRGVPNAPMAASTIVKTNPASRDDGVVTSSSFTAEPKSRDPRQLLRAATNCRLDPYPRARAQSVRRQKSRPVTGATPVF